MVLASRLFQAVAQNQWQKPLWSGSRKRPLEEICFWFQAKPDITSMSQAFTFIDVAGNQEQYTVADTYYHGEFRWSTDLGLAQGTT